MILPDGRVESCGNFHGAPLGFVCDFLAIATAEVGAIAERRTDRLLDATRSHGLPPFLTTDAGVNSGMMIAHYTQAAWWPRTAGSPRRRASTRCRPARCRRTTSRWAGARPASCASRSPTWAGSWRSRCRARRAGSTCARRCSPAPATAAALAALRAEVPGPGPDRFLAPELAAAERLVRSGALLAATEAATGPLE